MPSKKRSSVEAMKTDAGEGPSTTEELSNVVYIGYVAHGLPMEHCLVSWPRYQRGLLCLRAGIFPTGSLRISC